MNRRKTLVYAGIVMLALAGLSGFGAQATTYNATDGASLVAAVAAANANPGADTIVLAPGTYALGGALAITDDLTLQGPMAGVDARPGAGSTRDGSTGEAVLDASAMAAASDQRIVFLVQASNVVIDGLTVTGLGANSVFPEDNQVLRAYGKNGVAFVNNIVRGHEDGGELFVFEAANGFTFANNYIENGNGAPSTPYMDRLLRVENAAGITIDANEVRMGSLSGGQPLIEVLDGSGVDITGNTFHGLVPSTNHGDVLRISGALSATMDISRNTIAGLSAGNTAAIHIQGAAQFVDLYENVLYDNVNRFESPDTPTHRPLADTYAIWVEAGSDIDAYDNQIYGNDVGLRVESAYAGGDASSPLDATLNWWGHESGPFHASNPTGNGDVVEGNALVDPFRTSAPIGALVQLLGGIDPTNLVACQTAAVPTTDPSNPVLFTTVQQAIDCADANTADPAGPRVLLAHALYVESIDVPGGVTVCQRNQAGDACANPATPTLSVLEAPSGSSSVAAVSGDNARIDGLTLRHLGDYPAAGTHVISVNGDGVAIANNILRVAGGGCHAVGAASGGDPCEQPAAVNGITILGGSAGAAITGNLISADLPADDGTLGGSEGFRGDINGGELSGNTFSGWVHMAAVAYGANIAVADNVFDGNNNGLLICTGPDQDVTGNTFNAHFAAFFVTRCNAALDGLVLRDNHFAASNLEVIHFQPSMDGHGYRLDARLNHWDTDSWRLLDQRIGGSISNNVVQQIPFLLADGTVEPALATASSHAGTTGAGGSCEAHADAEADCSFLTIQAAIDFADTGATVTVPGSGAAVDPTPYTGSLAFTTPGLTLSGASLEQVVIAGDSATAVLVDAPGVTLQDVTVTNSGDNQFQGIRLTGNGDDFTFDGGVIEVQPTDCPAGCYSGAAVHAVLAANTATGLTVSNSAITSLPATDGDSYGFAGEGIVTEFSGSGTPTVTIADNSFTGWVLGLKLTGAGLVSGNDFAANQGHVTSCGLADGLRYEANTFSATLGASAFRIGGGCDAAGSVLRQNTFEWAGSPPITLTAGAFGGPVDARLNDWQSDEWRVVQARAGDDVAFLPFLGSVHPPLPVANIAVGQAACDAHPDAEWIAVSGANGDCRLLSPQAGFDLGGAGTTVALAPDQSADPAPWLASSVSMQGDDQTLCGSVGGVACMATSNAGRWAHNADTAWAEFPSTLDDVLFVAGGGGSASLFTQNLQTELDSLDDLHSLSFDFYVASGPCGAGSPRFGFVYPGGQAYAYSGQNGGCAAGQWHHVDIFEDPGVFWTTQGAGGSYSSTDYATAVADMAGQTFGTIRLYWDNGADVYLDNIRVNDHVLAGPIDEQCQSGACPFKDSRIGVVLDGSNGNFAVDASGDGATISGLTVHNSVISNGGGIRLAGDQATVAGVSVIGNLDQEASTFDVWGSQEGIQISGADWTVQDSLVTGWDNMGIQVPGGGDGSLVGNTIAFNTNHGLYVGGAAGTLTATANVFGAHDNTAVRLATTRDTVFRDNHFTPGNNNVSMHVHDGATNGAVDARANHWGVMGRDVIPSLFSFDTNANPGLIQYMPYLDDNDGAHPPYPQVSCYQGNSLAEPVTGQEILDLADAASFDRAAANCDATKNAIVVLGEDIEAYDGATFTQPVILRSANAQPAGGDSDNRPALARIRATATTPGVTLLGGVEGVGPSTQQMTHLVSLQFDQESGSTGILVEGLSSTYPVTLDDTLRFVGTDLTGTGIHARNGAAPTIADIQTAGIATAVAFEGTTGGSVRDSILAGDARGILLNGATGATIADNAFTGVGFTGLGIEDTASGGLLVTGNTFTGYGSAMWATSTPHGPDVISDNVIVGMDRGLILDSSPTGDLVSVEGNTFDDLFSAVELQGSGNTPAHFRFRGNEFGPAIEATFDVRQAGISNNAIDAQYNHWYAYDHEVIQGRMDQAALGSSNVVDSSCFLEMDRITAICPPVVDFTYLVQPGAGYPKHVDFTASIASDANITSINWDFDNGFTASGNPVTSKFHPGGYNPSVTVRDAANYEVSVSHFLGFGVNYGLTLVRDDITPRINAAPGQELTLTATLTNTGNVPDSYLISTQDAAGWGWTHEPVAASLAPGESTTIYLNVTAPNAAGGQIYLRASSAGDSDLRDSVSWITAVPIRTFVSFTDNGNFYEGDAIEGIIDLEYADGTPVVGQVVDMTHYHALLRGLGLGSVTKGDASAATDADGRVRFSFDASNAPGSALRGTHVIEIGIVGATGNWSTSAEVEVRPVLLAL